MHDRSDRHFNADVKLDLSLPRIPQRRRVTQACILPGVHSQSSTYEARKSSAATFLGLAFETLDASSCFYEIFSRLDRWRRAVCFTLNTLASAEQVLQIDHRT
eukprot:6206097-Pleurochrysis_carterae.AAC.5